MLPSLADVVPIRNSRAGRVYALWVLLRGFFYLIETCCEALKLFSRSCQHGFLNLKLFTCYEIQFAQPGSQHAAEISFQIIAH